MVMLALNVAAFLFLLCVVIAFWRLIAGALIIAVVVGGICLILAEHKSYQPPPLAEAPIAQAPPAAPAVIPAVYHAPSLRSQKLQFKTDYCAANADPSFCMQHAVVTLANGVLMPDDQGYIRRMNGVMKVELR